MDPFQALKMFMGKGGNPQQFIANMFSNSGGNPMIGNLVKMANTGNVQNVENFARNICKERGLDFDKEYVNFMNKLR